MKWIQTPAAELWASECAEQQVTVWLCAFQSVVALTNAGAQFLHPLLADKRTTFLTIFLFKASKGISEKNNLHGCYRICKCHSETVRKACCMPNASWVRPVLAFE